MWQAVAGVLLLSASLQAQERVPLEGSVQDAQTGAPVPGARIIAPELQVGTVSSVRGTFRLLLPLGTHELRVRSMGYEEAVLQAKVPGEPLQVRLRPLPIELPGVRVQVELSAEEILRNAMARRLENWRRLRTLQGLLYSKLLLGAGAAGPLRPRLRLDVGGEAGELGMEDTVFAILETFARFSYEAERGWRAEILQRRQTRNVPPEFNRLVFAELGSLYQEELELLGVRIPSPIGPAALERYRFRLLERRVWGESIDTTSVPRLAYVLELEPRSRLFPGFAGTVVIADSSFALMEARLRLAEGTAVPFLQEMELVQRYERLPGELWYPLETTISGRYRAVLLRGIADVGGEFRLTRILTEVRANEPLPDTVFQTEERIRVAPLADSLQTDFWRRFALLELSPYEEQIYRRMDTLAASTQAQRVARALFAPSVVPLVGFSRVDSWRVGVELSGEIAGVQPSAAVLYTAGTQRWQGWAQIRLPRLHLLRMPWELSLEMLARTEPMGWDRAYPELLNSVAAAVLHRDYYDWVYRTGWRAALQVRPLRRLSLLLEVERSWQDSLPVRASRSLFSRTSWRGNPPATVGNYRLWRTQLAAGSAAQRGRLFGQSLQLGAIVDLLAGRARDGKLWSVQRAELQAVFPTLSTGGYEPMRLGLWAELGNSTGAALPVQYAFRMRTAYAGMGATGHLLSAPVGVYGGGRTVALAAEHNFGDLWWRALGLPTMRGRGLELLLSGRAARFEKPVAAYQTTTGWYAELGIGLGRIPLWVTELVGARVEVAWGVGALARGRWGAAARLEL